MKPTNTMIDDIQTPKPVEPSVEPKITPEPPKTEVVNEEVKPEPFRVGQAYDPNAKKEDKLSPNTEQLADSAAKPPRPKKSKKKKILIALLILIILAAGAFAGWWFGFRDSGKPTSTSNVNDQEAADTTVVNQVSDLVPSSLSGALVSSADAARPVTGIMIENSGDARPQSGLKEADVVFEAIAEGGITRFLALFQVKQPDYIGPVRSARPYYVEWAAAFDASYAHAGGSPDGIARISELGVKDINAFAYGSDIFYRTEDRFAPHNLYTSFAGLDKVNTEKGYTTSTFTPWSRKDDVPQAVSAKSIDITISSDFYNPHYDYDAATNSYLRSEGGAAHLDEKSGKQLSPNNVLVMVMDRSTGSQYNVYNTTGSGAFVAFQDGVVSEGTWTRAGDKDQYKFTDKYGFDFLFNRGQTWVSIIDSREDVRFAP